MGNRKLRILFLVSTLNVANGVNSFVMNYFRKLNHEEIQIDILMYFDRKSPYIDEICSNGGHVYLAPPISNLKQHIHFCDRIIKSGNYDIIHDNTLIVSIPIMMLAKMRNIKVRILHSHATKMGDTLWKNVRNTCFIPILKGTATHYFACSEAAGKAMFGKHKYVVIPNVINAKEYVFNSKKRNDIRKMMHVQNKKVIATVGRCSMQKNPFFALDIIKRCIKKCPNIEYWWIGNGPLSEEMKQYVCKLGIDNNVKLLGERRDVKDLYQAIDCFFLPSLFEGLPVTGIEAQAMGIPLVVSDTVTSEMVITDIVEFLSLDDGDNKWANKLNTVLDKPIDREYYSKQFVNSKYSDSKCGEKLVDIYLSIMESLNPCIKR